MVYFCPTDRRNGRHVYCVITKLLEETADGTLIEFQTELAIGRGLWWAYNTPPQIGQGYVVELDISDDLHIGEIIEIVDGEEYILRWQDDVMLIQGKIDVVWDDGSGVSVSVRTPQSLSGIDEVYTQGQITNHGVYQSLREKLIKAQRDLTLASRNRQSRSSRISRSR